ncbi:hypothetical protein [Vibrio nigripulchritudo]|uniref:hypothetical protein n=1 Tax=Vibrio nigripulchritudo TaxID=28173 RepID=UPI00190DEB88|nr:hypothetical protein [Vibrio nigripulchritudo]
MSKLNDYLRTLNEDNADISRQSKLSSLRMNALKTLTPILIKGIKTSVLEEQTFHEGVAKDIKKTIELQQSVNGFVSRICGGFKATDYFVYRRTWLISSTAVSSSYTLPLDTLEKLIFFESLLMSSDEESQLFLERLGIKREVLDSYQDFMPKIIETTPYTDEQSFYKSVESTLFSTSINFSSFLRDQPLSDCGREVSEILIKGSTYISYRLLQLFEETAHSEQESMRIKSCVSHASKIVLSIAETACTKINAPIDAFRLAEFDEIVSNFIDCVIENLEYSCKLVSETLLALEEDHTPSFVSGSAKSELSLSVCLDIFEKNLPLMGACCINNQTAPANCISASYANSLASGLKQFNHTYQLISKKLADINPTLNPEAYRYVWDSILPILTYSRRRDLHIPEQHLLISANISALLISDFPIKENLIKAGLSQEEVSHFRSVRDKTLHGIGNPLQYKQILIPTVCEIARTLGYVQSFCYGLNVGYLSPFIATHILEGTNALILSRSSTIGKNSQQEISLFQSCLRDATTCFIKNWTYNSEETLGRSSKTYFREQISFMESRSIIERIGKEYLKDITSIIGIGNNVLENFDSLIPGKTTTSLAAGFEDPKEEVELPEKKSLSTVTKIT